MPLEAEAYVAAYSKADEMAIRFRVLVRHIGTIAANLERNPQTATAISNWPSAQQIGDAYLDSYRATERARGLYSALSKDMKAHAKHPDTIGQERISIPDK